MRFGFFFLFYWYLPHPYTHNGYHSLIISTLVSEMAFNECDCIGLSNLFDEIYVTKPNTINIVHPLEKRTNRIQIQSVLAAETIFVTMFSLYILNMFIWKSFGRFSKCWTEMIIQMSQLISCYAFSYCAS